MKYSISIVDPRALITIFSLLSNNDENIREIDVKTGSNDYILTMKIARKMRDAKSMGKISPLGGPSVPIALPPLPDGLFTIQICDGNQKILEFPVFSEVLSMLYLFGRITLPLKFRANIECELSISILRQHQTED